MPPLKRLEIRWLTGWRRGCRDEGVGEGLLAQQEVCRSQDRRCHELARVGGRAGLVQLAGVQLVQLQLGGHWGGGHRGGLAGGVHQQVVQLGCCLVREGGLQPSIVYQRRSQLARLREKKVGMREAGVFSVSTISS